VGTAPAAFAHDCTARAKARGVRPDEGSIMSRIVKKEPEAKAISVRFTATELSCSERSVWRLLASGQLKSVRIGRSVKITRESIDAFIAKGGAR
jgi:excisionase family DNA binding protein